MSDTLTIRTNYSGSEHTRDDVHRQILERFGPELAKEYDPYINCMTLPQWSSRGYRVKPGQKSLRSIVMIEKKDKNGEVISSFPRNIFLFFYPQVKRLPNYGNN